MQDELTLPGVLVIGRVGLAHQIRRRLLGPAVDPDVQGMQPQGDRIHELGMLAGDIPAIDAIKRGQCIPLGKEIALPLRMTGNLSAGKHRLDAQHPRPMALQ